MIILEEIKKRTNCKIFKLQHCHRLNGIVDIWNNEEMIYLKPENKYLHFKNKSELIETAVSYLLNTPEQDNFKNTAKGRMTYQEFKNKLKYNS